MARVKQIGEIKIIEIVGRGENIKDVIKRIFLSKSGLKIIEEFEKEWSEKEKNINKKMYIPYMEKDYQTLLKKYISKGKIYFNKNNKHIFTTLTKEDLKNKIVTILEQIDSSYRGTSYIEETSPNVTFVSATGSGRIGEHTEFIATIPNGGYIIAYSGGRYHKGWSCWKNVDGEIKRYEYYNSEKYCDKPDFEEAKIAFGLAPCDFCKEE